MKNITVTMDEETARWARVEAARRGVSVSRMLGEILHQQRLDDAEYGAARQRYLKRKPKKLKSEGQPYPERSSLHERGDARRYEQ